MDVWGGGGKKKRKNEEEKEKGLSARFPYDVYTHYTLTVFFLGDFCLFDNHGPLAVLPVQKVNARVLDLCPLPLLDYFRCVCVCVCVCACVCVCVCALDVSMHTELLPPPPLCVRVRARAREL